MRARARHCGGHCHRCHALQHRSLFSQATRLTVATATAVGAAAAAVRPLRRFWPRAQAARARKRVMRLSCGRLIFECALARGTSVLVFVASTQLDERMLENNYVRRGTSLARALARLASYRLPPPRSSAA